MTDATSPCPLEVSSEVLSDPAAVLFGLEDEFSVLHVERTAPDAIKVLVELTAREGPCPACGVLTSAVKERPLSRLKDLPASGQRVELWWRKRRLACRETLCPRRSFTQTCAAVRPGPGHRTAPRSGGDGDRVGATGLSSDVAAEYGVSWPTAHKALIAAAARWLPAPKPTPVLGIDETRFRIVRWILDGITWKRSDPWLTSFVDCSADGPGSLLGLAPGRTGGCVKDWLAEQTPGFRKTIADRGDRPVRPVCLRHPSRAAGRGDRGRQMAPGRAGAHHGHRGPPTRHPRTAGPTRHHRRPGVGEPADAAHRRRAPVGQAVGTAVDWLRQRNDPTKEIQAAWAVKERLRMLLAQREPSKIRWALADFYEAVLDAHLPEATRLAGTIERWWPAILVALTAASPTPGPRVQPDHQADQTGRLRLPEHDQLPTPYPDPHRGHPTARSAA